MKASQPMNTRTLVCGFLAFVALSANTAFGHFVWLGSKSTDKGQQALLFFSEGPHDTDYHLPQPIATAELYGRTADGERHLLETTTVEEDDYTGLVAALPEESNTVALETVCQYGIYGGSLLTYYAQHAFAEEDGTFARIKPSSEMHITLVPKSEAGGISITVLWKGEPLADASVTLVDASEESVKQTTDEKGRTLFKIGKSGVVGFLVGHTEKDQPGEHNGGAYGSKSHYGSLTLDYKPVETQSHAPPPRQRDSQTSTQRTNGKPETGATLPEAVASFGAAVQGDWLYAYGGHTGRAHQHSRENLSSTFVRIHLQNPDQQEELPMQTPLQGLALVNCGDYLYRVGGMQALNHPDDEADMHSVDEFARFDPESRTWTALPSLPDGRSSHDAAVWKGKIYVIGGWTLAGSSDGEWQDMALMYDTSAGVEGEWNTLPAPPFHRRALAVAMWQDRIWALGGMDEFGMITRSAYYFDPQRGFWSEGPEMPGDGSGMQGFGISAWGHDSGLYVSGTDGILYRLTDVDGQWEEVAELKIPRFFHRLLPAGKNKLVAIAGATLSQGHTRNIEELPVGGK